MKTFKPMLAGAIDTSNMKIKYPVLGSPKLDGIRCITYSNGDAISRNLKPIANAHIRSTMKATLQRIGISLDGELISGKTFQATTSAVMSEDGTPDFTYWVFDKPIITSDAPFSERFAMVERTVKSLSVSWLKVVPHKIIRNDIELIEFERECLAAGFEGVMIRSLTGKYKCGRSTVNEGILLKLKRFADAEAEIIGFEPRYTNKNEAKKDALGHTKRSMHKDNMIATDTLGALKVRWKGIEFSIGTGIDDATRKSWWGIRQRLIGQFVKFKYQEAGVKEAPRFPVIIGLRDKNDL